MAQALGVACGTAAFSSGHPANLVLYAKVPASADIRAMGLRQVQRGDSLVLRSDE